MRTMRNRNYATVRMSPFWILFEQRMMEVMMTIGVIRRAKLRLNRRHQHQQQTNTPLLATVCPPVAQPTASEI